MTEDQRRLLSLCVVIEDALRDAALTYDKLRAQVHDCTFHVEDHEITISAVVHVERGKAVCAGD